MNSLSNQNHFSLIFDKQEESDDFYEKNQNISITNGLEAICKVIQEENPPQITKTIGNINYNPSNNINNDSNSCSNLNLSQIQFPLFKKEQYEDKSYISMEQEEDFKGEESILNNNNITKIGKDEHNAGIDPIIEMNSFEEGQNDSFIHENNFLFQKMNELSYLSNTNNNGNSNNYNLNNLTMQYDNLGNFKSDSKMDMTSSNFLNEDLDLAKIRKNLMCLKISKSSLSFSNQTSHLKTNESSYDNNNKKLMFNVFKSSEESLSTSCLISDNSKMLNKSLKTKGRKTLLLKGVKTEIVDKAFLREFKKYIKNNIKNYNNILEEDALFWREFLERSNPPFTFTLSNNKKFEFKSYSRNLMKFIFSKGSVRKLYQIFISEKQDYLFNSFIKKSKKNNFRTLVFYKYYGQNLHKIYSDEYSLTEINCDDELENNNNNDVSVDNLMTRYNLDA